MKKKILVVDDDVSIRSVIGLILKTLDDSAFYAENWKGAIEILKREKLDILMTDFRMPVMEGINNGIELIRFIKLNKINPEMKIVLMSAEINNMIESVALAVGADVAVNKFEICGIETMERLLKNLLRNVVKAVRNVGTTIAIYD